MLAQVLVVGAGYAGLMAANRLAAAGQSGVSVTVVNPRPEFVERVWLHEHAAGVSSAVRPLSGLLRRDVRLRVASVATIAERSVQTRRRWCTRFRPSAVRGGKYGCPTFDRVRECAQCRRPRRRRVAAPATAAPAGGGACRVIGGGLTGIETSAEIAYRYPTLDVDLMSQAVAARLPESSRVRIERQLANAGVRLRTGPRVSGVRPDAVETDAGRLPSDCTVWAGSFDVPDLAQRSGLPVPPTAACASTIPWCARNIGGSSVSVTPSRQIGDHLRMSCQAAIPLGTHGADTVLALIRG